MVTTTTESTGDSPTTKASTKSSGAAKSGKPELTSSAPSPKVVTVSDPVVGEADLRKKELIDLVVARSGIKKKDAKPVIEAMLAVLGEAVGDSRGFNLQPMGKLRINRSEEKSNGRVIVCKLRQSVATITAPDDAPAKVAE